MPTPRARRDLLRTRDQIGCRLYAGRTEIVVYLRTLIFWLNSDPWPEDMQLRGPGSTPAAIERKLRITATNKPGKSDLDAYGLAQQCQRLVILGGSCSGKTWLARLQDGESFNNS